MKKVLIRIASVTLAMSIILSFALVSVSATDNVPEIVKKDYAPTDDGNFVDTYPTTVAPTTYSQKVSVAISGSTATFTSNDVLGAHGQWGLTGFKIDSKFISTETNVAPKLTKGTKILFGAKVRKSASSTSDPKINVAYASWYQTQYENKTPYYADKYSTVNDGFLVESTEWTNFETVITVPEACGGNTWNLIFGYSSGTESGAVVEIDMSSIYFAVESAYDIDVTTKESAVYAGATTTAKAEIVNQHGDKFSGEQGGFSWYVLTDDREAFASGIDITDNCDGTAKVSVTSEAQAGTYDIVAVSDVYDEFVKGTSIEVKVLNLADSVPVDNGNHITKVVPEGANVTGNSGDVSCGTTGNVTTLTAKNNIGATKYGLNGFVVNDTLFDERVVPEAGDKILFGAKVKNASDSAAETGKIAIVSQRAQAGYIWPDGVSGDTDGFDIEGADWVDYSAVISVPEGSNWDQYRSLVVGFPNGTVAGTKVSIDLSTMFYGIEKAYGLNITADSEKTTAGGEITVFAEVLNQLGKAYSEGNDNVSWYAMNEDRTEFVDDIVITKGENGTATVSVSDTAEAGRYTIVAVHNESDELVKGITITVKTFKDYVPAGDDGNHITKVVPEGANVTGNSGDVSCGTTGNVTTLTAKNNIGATKYGLNGFVVNDTLFDERVVPEAGDKILFGAKVKNASDSAAETGKIAIVSQRAQAGYIWPDGVSGDTDGFDIEGADWVDYSAVISVPEGSNWDQYRSLVVGFPNGTVAGTKVSIDLSTMFYGIEKAYDIDVTADNNTVVQGSTFTVSAKILNQLDRVYSGGNGDFDWYAMDTDRKEIIDGITITKAENGMATVAVADTVEEGDYTIVAVSEDYDGFVKGLTITVEEADVIEGITLSENNGLVTVATDTALINAKLIFASYEANGRMLDCKETTVNLDAQMSEGYSPADLKKGSYTKAMLINNWSELIPLTNFIQY